MDEQGRHRDPLRRTPPRPEAGRPDTGQASRRRPLVGRRHVLDPAGGARPLRGRLALRRDQGAGRRPDLAPGPCPAVTRPRRQDLGAARRRHAAGHRRAPRPGEARPGAHGRRYRLVESAPFGAVRRNAAPHRRLEPRGDGGRRQVLLATASDARRIRTSPEPARHRRADQWRGVAEDADRSDPSAGILRQ